MVRDVIFTKVQMLGELKIIYLFKADDLALSYGDDHAQSLMGFKPSEGRHDYCQEDPDKVDLSRFPITPQISTAYDFAFRPSILNGALTSDQVQDLLQFRANFPTSGGVFLAGETHDFMTPEGKCWTCIDALFARWKLEWEPGAEDRFTIRELALLADMTEGAVRNALADKGESSLRAIPASKPLSVDYEEAKRWLAGRRGFIPTPKRASDDRFLLRQLANTRTADAFSKLLRQLLLDRHQTLKTAGMALGWDEAEVETWCRGTFAFDLDKVTALSRVVGVELPLLAGKALELWLRRSEPPPV